VIPDRLHLALRGDIEQCPEEIALALMDNPADVFSQNPTGQSSYYAGIFGDYDWMQCVAVDSHSQPEKLWLLPDEPARGLLV
jgi:hypothetical protein